MSRERGCKSCDMTDPQNQPVGGAIQVGEHWLLNQYWGGEGFLGWMALGPKEHRMQLEDLSPEETSEMGTAIQKIKKALKEYWKEVWPEDRFDRLYVTYFFESVFGNKPNEYHLHIHLIPRTKKMRALISNKGNIVCWDIYKISSMDGFPEEYLRYEERVLKLMNALRAKISY
jgi:diadenosine tetraphosphate (Ap4A) HIT family hydrolase